MARCGSRRRTTTRVRSNSFDWMGRNRFAVVRWRRRGPRVGRVPKGQERDSLSSRTAHDFRRRAIRRHRSRGHARRDREDGEWRRADGGSAARLHRRRRSSASAAYVGTAESYGERNKLVFVFLDDGRLVHAGAGPAGAFNDGALTRVLAALVANNPGTIPATHTPRKTRSPGRRTIRAASPACRTTSTS